MAAPWEKYATPAAGYGPDPYKVAEEQRKQKASELAQQAADRANNNSEVANANAANAAAIARQRLDMELAAKGLMVGSDGQITARPGGPVGGKPPVDPARIAKLNSLIDQINRTQELYAAGPGKTEGVAGIADYLPYDANVQFDTSGAQLSEKGLSAFRIPGSGTMTDRDAAMFERANMPTASTRDIAIEEQLGGIRSRVDAELEALGLPNANWKIGAPQDRDDAPAMPAGQPPQGVDKSTQWLGNAPESQPGGFVPYGQEYRTVDNPELKGVNARINGMLKAGAPAQDIVAYMRSAGVNPDDPEIAAGLNSVMQFRQKNPQYRGGYNVNLDDMTVPMSGFEQARNNIPQTMAGTALATAGNAGGFGLPQMLAGNEGLAYLRQQNPVSAFAGDVGGVIGGTAAVGAVGRNTVGRAIPAWLGGGSKAAAGRQLATDATYGGIYGATTEGDPVTGALTAGVGSAGGQLLGKGIQKTFAGGGDLAAAALQERGIPLTVGQALGGVAKRFEDGSTSIPLIGDVINARRGEGLEAFNRAAFQDAGAPIGAQVDEVGEAGIDALRPQISRAYDRATEGVNVPLDQQYATDLAPFLAQGSALAGDYGAGFGRMVNNRVRPALDAGELTGANYQNMMRGMRDSRASVKGQPFAEDYIEPVQGMEAATRALMERQGGAGVMAGLGRADEAYRNSKVLGKAIEAGKNNDGIFMPSQLNAASTQNANKFGGNGATENRPFRDLAMIGQKVLPSKLADSGTPLRLGIGGGLFTAATSVPTYLSSGDVATAAAAPVGTTGLLALLGTKQGQKALVSALTKRSPKAKKLGGIFGGRKARQAIAGGITAPLLIE